MVIYQPGDLIEFKSHTSEDNFKDEEDIFDKIARKPYQTKEIGEIKCWGFLGGGGGAWGQAWDTPWEDQA